jgi:hypothetical protein
MANSRVFLAGISSVARDKAPYLADLSIIIEEVSAQITSMRAGRRRAGGKRRETPALGRAVLGADDDMGQPMPSSAFACAGVHDDMVDSYIPLALSRTRFQGGDQPVFDTVDDLLTHLSNTAA